MPRHTHTRWKVELTTDDKTIDQVIRLADANTNRLGFVPAQALRRAAHRNGILVVKDARGQVLGYVWHSVTESSLEARIHHLCVGTENRSKGVGRALVEAVKERTKHLGAVVLRCRRDFRDSCDFWCRMGFVPEEERRGRGKAASSLTCFRLDHGQPNLWTEYRDQLAHSKAVAALDANVFFDLGDPAQPEHETSQALLAPWVADYATLWITPELYREIHRQDDPDRRRQGWLFARSFDRLTPQPDCTASTLKKLEGLLPTARSISDQSDRRHLACAIAANADFFITRDKLLLTFSPVLAEAFHLDVVSPLQFILSIDQIQRAWYYQPARLAGSGLQIQPMVAHAADQLSQDFLNHSKGEKRAAFNTTLAAVASRLVTVEAHVVRHGTRNEALLVVSNTSDVVTIQLLRTRESPFARTLACHLALKAMRTSVGDRPCTVILADEKCPDSVRMGCRDLGFIPLGDRLIKFTIPGLLTLTETDGLLACLGSTKPELSSAIERMRALVVAAQSRDCPLTKLSSIEHLLWPLKLNDGRLPCFMVPIEPRWAKHLFDERLAQQDLFSVDTSRALQHENVYYRSGSLQGMRAPGRILWYESKDDGYAGTSQICACSQLEEVVIGSASDLYKRFSPLGIFTWQEVLAVAHNRPQERIMAFRFSGTELTQAVPRERIRQVWNSVRGRTPQFTTVLELRVEEFSQLYKPDIGGTHAE